MVDFIENPKIKWMRTGCTPMTKENSIYFSPGFSYLPIYSHNILMFPHGFPYFLMLFPMVFPMVFPFLRRIPRPKWRGEQRKGHRGILITTGDPPRANLRISVPILAGWWFQPVWKNISAITNQQSHECPKYGGIFPRDFPIRQPKNIFPYSWPILDTLQNITNS